MTISFGEDVSEKKVMMFVPLDDDNLIWEEQEVTFNFMLKKTTELFPRLYVGRVNNPINILRFLTD